MSNLAEDNKKLKPEAGASHHVKVPFIGYVALTLFVLFVSGIFTHSESFLKAIDFVNILGKWGALGEVKDTAAVTLAPNFTGIGATGIRAGFMIAFTVTPGVILSFGVTELFVQYQGDKAAGKLFGPIFRLLFGLPGETLAAIIASLTSTDAGAGLAKNFHDRNIVNDYQVAVLSTFMYMSPAVLVNLYSLSTPLLPYIPVSLSIPLVIILVFKILGTLVARFILKKVKVKA